MCVCLRESACVHMCVCVFQASSGDDGAPGAENSNAPFPNCPQLYPQYPASSPYVTSVGATMIIDNQELVCTYNLSLITTGGGFASDSPQPAYQSAFTAAYLRSNATKPSFYFNTSGRGYPDVALAGRNYLVMSRSVCDQSYICDLCFFGRCYANCTDCSCFMGSNLESGTSASTPTFGAMVTLMNDWRFKHGFSALGFLNPLLYEMAVNFTDSPPVFHDITTGHNHCTAGGCCNNMGFEAAVGWDPAVGPLTSSRCSRRCAARHCSAI